MTVYLYYQVNYLLYTRTEILLAELTVLGWGRSSVGEHLQNTCKALGLGEFQRCPDTVVVENATAS